LIPRGFDGETVVGRALAESAVPSEADSLGNYTLVVRKSGRMRRRTLIGAVGAGLATAAAGRAGDDGADETEEPEPSESELRLVVENNHSEPQSLTFLLQITWERTTVTEAFESGEIPAGETWEREPQTLEAGEYELAVQIPTLEMETETQWVGHDCPLKEVELELVDDGFRMRTDCPEQ
jgi:hypothetical protein